MAIMMWILYPIVRYYTNRYKDARLSPLEHDKALDVARMVSNDILKLAGVFLLVNILGITALGGVGIIKDILVVLCSLIFTFAVVYVQTLAVSIATLLWVIAEPILGIPASNIFTYYTTESYVDGIRTLENVTASLLNYSFE